MKLRVTTISFQSLNLHETFLASADFFVEDLAEINIKFIPET